MYSVLLTNCSPLLLLWVADDSCYWCSVVAPVVLLLLLVLFRSVVDAVVCLDDGEAAPVSQVSHNTLARKRRFSGNWRRSQTPRSPHQFWFEQIRSHCAPGNAGEVGVHVWGA